MSNTREHNDIFWVDMDSAVSPVPSGDYMFVLINANARTGVRIGEEDCKVIGVCGRDTRVSDSNGTALLRFAGDNKLFAGDNKLALVKTFFYVPKGCTSRTFNGTRPADRKRINDIITRQLHCKLVRNVTSHLQPRRIPTTVLCEPETDSPANSLVIENSEPPQDARVFTDE